LFLVGVVAYRSLPVAAFRGWISVVSVSASLPGADPATVASSVAAPLERRLGQIAGVTEMTSVSTLGGTSITLQFDLIGMWTERRGTCKRRSTPRLRTCDQPARPADLPEDQPRGCPRS